MTVATSSILLNLLRFVRVVVAARKCHSYQLWCQGLIQELNLGGDTWPMSLPSVARQAKNAAGGSGVRGEALLAPPKGTGWSSKNFAFFTPILPWNALHFNCLYVSFLQECILVSSGIVIAIKFGIQFIDKNVR